MVSPSYILTAIPARLTKVRHQVDWIPLLNVYETSRDVSPVVRTDGSNQTRLSRPSAVSPFLAEPFEIFMAAAMASSVCCASLPPLCSCRSRDQVVVVAACCFSVQFSAFFFPLPRTHRPFKLFMPLFDSILYRQRFSRASVVTSLAFLHFFYLTRCLSCCFTCYRCICSHLIHSFGPFVFWYTRSFRTCYPPLHLLGSVYFLFRVARGSRSVCPILMRGGSLRFGVESLTW